MLQVSSHDECVNNHKQRAEWLWGLSIIVHIDTSVVGKRLDTGGCAPHRNIRDTAAFPLDRELMGTQWETIILHLALIYESTYREAQQGSSRQELRLMMTKAELGNSSKHLILCKKEEMKRYFVG